MIDTLQAGDSVKCTISKVPNNHGSRATITRLMRRDPEIKRGLARAQRMRRQRMHAYIRGGRMWYSREKAAQIAICEQGNSWSMRFTHDIAPDIASVEQYLSIEKA
ncbi:MAG: hypothetical protein CMJ35_11185 [Phycisphaerae bacterium]|nr:hypothetical protein [Phycisphaerae bacterium]MBM92157.1 hypothetical protein [Phycisphaerae bacterium]HCT46732.1 hypothetical protein [Phycisphaerales bacterium]|tara:strand:- start:828 stop:1145 length:318 start_codon:yes stop_codon:yes gene_type:complete